MFDSLENFASLTSSASLKVNLPLPIAYTMERKLFHYLVFKPNQKYRKRLGAHNYYLFLHAAFDTPALALSRPVVRPKRYSTPTGVALGVFIVSDHL